MNNHRVSICLWCWSNSITLISAKSLLIPFYTHINVAFRSLLYISLSLSLCLFLFLSLLRGQNTVTFSFLLISKDTYGWGSKFGITKYRVTIFRNSKISNIEITKEELFHIFEFIPSFFRNYLSTQNIWQFLK